MPSIKHIVRSPWLALAALLLGLVVGVALVESGVEPLALSDADRNAASARIDARVDSLERSAIAFQRDVDQAQLAPLQDAQALIEHAPASSSALGLIWFALMSVIALSILRGAFLITERLRNACADFPRSFREVAMTASPLSLLGLVIGGGIGAACALAWSFSFDRDGASAMMLAGFSRGSFLIEMLGTWCLIAATVGAALSLMIWLVRGEAAVFPGARTLRKISAHLDWLAALAGGVLIGAHSSYALRFTDLLVPALIAALTTSVGATCVLRAILRKRDIQRPSLHELLRTCTLSFAAQNEFAALAPRGAGDHTKLRAFGWFALFSRAASAAAMVCVSVLALQAQGVEIRFSIVLLALGMALPFLWTQRRGFGHWHLSYAGLASVLVLSPSAAAPIACVSLLLAPCAVALDALLSLHFAALCAGTPALQTLTQPDPEPATPLRIVPQ